MDANPITRAMMNTAAVRRKQRPPAEGRLTSPAPKAALTAPAPKAVHVHCYVRRHRSARAEGAAFTTASLRALGFASLDVPSSNGFGLTDVSKLPQ